MIDKENLHEWIARFIAGTLSEQEMMLLQEYLTESTKPVFQDELDRALQDFLSDTDLLAFRKAAKMACQSYGIRRKPNFFLMAATIALFLATSSLFLFRFNAKTLHPITLAVFSMIENMCFSNTPQANEIPTEYRFFGNGLPCLAYCFKSPVDQGDHFKSLPYLESLVGIVTRSGSFSLLIPHDSISQRPGEPLLFVWQDQCDACCSLEIIDNKGVRMWEGSQMTPGEWKVSTAGWSTGVYYWRIVRQESIASVGKIILRP